MKKLLVFVFPALFIFGLLFPKSVSSQARICGVDGVPATKNPVPGVTLYLDTAIGCIPITGDNNAVTNAFAGWFLGWAIGVSGGLALLLIVFSGFQIMTASGDPQKLQSGRELLTSAISGLILIIFSIFLLRLIGVQILNIPGLS